MRAVYVIAEADADVCKVGITNNPLKRLTLLQTGQPKKLILCAAWAVEDAESLEKAAHAALATRRLQGEWFAVAPEQAVFIIGRLCGEQRIDAEPVMIPASRREIKVRTRGSRYSTRAPISPLQRWRFENNLCFREMAAKFPEVGSYTTLMRIEKGERRPGRDLTRTLMAVTGLTAAELLEPWLKITSADEEAA